MAATSVFSGCWLFPPAPAPTRALASRTALSTASSDLPWVQDSSESPFLEPFVRSLVLGLGAAVVLESTHEMLQVRSCRGNSNG